MLNTADSSSLEYHSALVAHKLSRLNIDIAALSEAHFTDEGSLKGNGTGYTLFWSGKPSTERRLSVVGIMVRNSFVSKLDRLPMVISDRIMSTRLPLEGKQHLTQIPRTKIASIPICSDSCITPLQVTRSSLLATLTLELGGTPRPGKESLEDNALGTVITMGASCSNSVQSINSSLPTQSSNRKTP